MDGGAMFGAIQFLWTPIPSPSRRGPAERTAPAYARRAVRAAVIASFQGDAVLSVMLARFLRPFSCYGGSLSSKYAFRARFSHFSRSSWEIHRSEQEFVASS